MTNRFPGYDVMTKRMSMSWNEQTRAVIDARLAIDPTAHRFFTETEWQTLCSLCDRIVPQTVARPHPVPLAAMIDEKARANMSEGYRYAELPPVQQAWRLGLAAIDAEAQARHGRRFHDLAPLEQDTVLTAVQNGDVRDPTWSKLPPASFFNKRILHDIVSAYYSHPTAWNEIGFGGPAGPRGYVRMSFDRRDPWEASEARPGREAKARRENARVG